MTSTVTRTATLAASPEEVWAVIGDVGSVSTWIPALESSSIDGDLRTAEFSGGGGTAHERITAHDDAAKTYTYQYVDGPLALEHYVSTISVSGDGDGSLVTWTAEFAAGSPEEEVELQEAISGIYSSALVELAAHVAS